MPSNSFLLYRSEGFLTGYLVPGRVGLGPGPDWMVVVVVVVMIPPGCDFHKTALLLSKRDETLGIRIPALWSVRCKDYFDPGNMPNGRSENLRGWEKGGPSSTPLSAVL